LTRLPVIQVNSEKKKKSSGFRQYKVGKKELQVKSALIPVVLQEIVSITWATGMLPEPCRIAHLLARS